MYVLLSVVVQVMVLFWVCLPCHHKPVVP